MRRSVCALLGLALLAGLAVADDKEQKKGLEGFWQGSLKVGAVELRFAVALAKKPDGTFTGTLDSLDQGAKDIPIDEVIQKDADVTLNLKKVKASFEGKLSDDAKSIKGEWKQGGSALPLTLERADKKVELFRPQMPKKPYLYTEEEVTYENKKGGVKFTGTLTLPKGDGPFPAALLLTGSGAQDRD